MGERTKWLATTALVNNLIEHITYAHQGNGQPASVVLDLALSDGNSGGQGAGGQRRGSVRGRSATGDA